ncbi:hypothetical protein GcM3_001024 [Golovinomyces cichoracearum]|uniref:LYR motif-containing protein Cup1-like N-terminal domain-containing protein n=1 Tax=Golovinomyces cichoracearum TaxID=62708 RepID=A0A420JBC7_9PEZI|nr:hypothetical protein GcM3_001024 [Golovinomyces cichoracearum]
MRGLHTKSLSLYRGLLRAVSYFPDQYAQAIIRKQICLRFRKARMRAIEASNKNKTRKGFRSVLNSKEYIASLSQRISNGKQRLGVLTRAIGGDSDCFLKVLMIAYGRVGRRRRELIMKLLTDDPGDIPKDTAALIAMLNSGGNLEMMLESLNLKGGPKFNAFLKSQHKCRIKDVRDTIKELEPNIPKENIWGRSLPLKRVTNIKKEWWSTVLKKLLPPVSIEEFERLKGLSTGRVPLTWFSARRKPAVLLNKEDEMRICSQWINILKCPLRGLDETEIDKISCTPHGLEKDVDKLVDPPKYGRAPISKIIRSARSMRRLYGKVWALTSTMYADESTGKWMTEWGRGSSLYLAGHVTQPSPSDMVLFQGLEDF